jgi:hypothetical protein
MVADTTTAMTAATPNLTGDITYFASGSGRI